MATGPSGGDGLAWVDGGRGYQLAFDSGKVVCRNAAGKRLASVPKDVKDGEAFERLTDLQDWLARHEQECAQAVEGWMLRCLAAPRAVVAAAWPDAAWRKPLENAVVAPVVASGAADLDRAGLLKGVDPARGVGLVDRDGESRWWDVAQIAVPHPILLAARDDFRELSLELGLEQGLAQLYRETFPKPADLAEGDSEVTKYAGGEFKQLSHAHDLCQRHGFPVRGGNALCRVWVKGRRYEARFWIGSDDPQYETTTGDLSWVDDAERSLPLRDVPEVAWSEGMRMAHLVHAGRAQDEGEEGDDD